MVRESQVLAARVYVHLGAQHRAGHGAALNVPACGDKGEKGGGGEVVGHRKEAAEQEEERQGEAQGWGA